MKKEVPTAYVRHLDARERSVLDEGGHVRELTFRGFWVGSFLSFFLAVGAPYGNMIIRGSYMALDFSTPGAIFLFLVLIGIINVLFKLAGPCCTTPTRTAHLLIWGYVQSVNGIPHALLPQIVGALLARFYFWRRYGKQEWRRYAMVLTVGFGVGMSLIGMFCAALAMISKAVSSLQY